MKCPTCKKPVERQQENPFFPFCSEKCKMIDLGAWFNETYVIPGRNETSSEQNSQTGKQD